ncbi:MAG: substrate binding domain-containing protein [Phyllobacterium sp.]|uniref:substrate binding domain-containing protein n=1 Tax=Phyllobacterium sp. TaxID=1871046 RepID=UPI0030EFD701
MTGTLRITSTVAFGRRRLVPLLREFQALHPDLHIYLDASDTVANIIDGGFDLAIRVGELADSSLIARQIAPNVRVICGSRDYLQRRGRPVLVEQLVEHDCIVFGNPPLDHWSFADGRTVRVRGTFACNDGELAHAWALKGAGLVLKSIWDVQQDIEAGRLEVVLPELPLPAAPIHAVYPHSKHAAAKVRLCVAFLAERFKRDAGLLRLAAPSR